MRRSCTCVCVCASCVCAHVCTRYGTGTHTCSGYVRVHAPKPLTQPWPWLCGGGDGLVTLVTLSWGSLASKEKKKKNQTTEHKEEKELEGCEGEAQPQAPLTAPTATRPTCPNPARAATAGTQVPRPSGRTAPGVGGPFRVPGSPPGMAAVRDWVGPPLYRLTKPRKRAP